jgi:hypothetical protein
LILQLKILKDNPSELETSMEVLTRNGEYFISTRQLRLRLRD